MTFLEKIVNAEMLVNIQCKSRTTRHIDARLIFSYILYERGVTYQRIADHLQKNHATIINAVRNAKNYLKNEPDLYRRYKMCKTIFENNNHPVVEYTYEELLKSYFDLEEKYNKLEDELLEIKNMQNDLEL